MVLKTKGLDGKRGDWTGRDEMVWNETERHLTGLDRTKGFETGPVVIGRKWTGKDGTGRERVGAGWDGTSR